MNREYHKWYSPTLGREMELLVFGHAGPPVLVFPTSMGKFFEYEDRGMIGAVAGRYEHGHLQTFCVDSVDSESWYNKRVPPRWRIARHVQYENYILHEVLPFIRWKNDAWGLTVTGASFGGYHAVNFAMRHPDVATRCVSMGGAFDIRSFLHGYYDEDVYFHNPVDYLPNMSDGWFHGHYQRMDLVLAAGEHDICLGDNYRLAQILGHRGIPHKLHVWGDATGHDWPWWHKMAQAYF